MAKTVLLVRHGKPQAAGELPDKERPLTPEGLSALESPEGFARIAGLLAEPQRSAAVIWSSPAVRATQTAQVMAKALGGRPIEIHPCLWEQDPLAFQRELAAAQAPCVIAVGHIPFMDRMTEHLCGAQLPFKPGAVAAIQLDQQLHPGASNLLWFVQGPVTNA